MLLILINFWTHRLSRSVVKNNEARLIRIKNWFILIVENQSMLMQGQGVLRKFVKLDRVMLVANVVCLGEKLAMYSVLGQQSTV